jgi:putative FmdB family regulatory protein
MPIYAYKCESCGHAQDVLQKMSDAPLSVCPHCGASAFRKQVTAAGFQLKGSGWYATDFKGGAAATPTADKPAASDASTPTTTSPTTADTPAASSAPASSCGASCACH